MPIPAHCAANPCRCGYQSNPDRACARAPACGEGYLGRIFGPLLDRIDDLRVEVPPVAFTDFGLPEVAEGSAEVALRVAAARGIQTARLDGMAARLNANAEGQRLEVIAAPDTEGRDLLLRVAERFGLSARSYYRVLRVAQTIADLDGSEPVRRPHVAEAAGYRLALGRAP